MDRKYIRYDGFDYTLPRNYFITIVIHERLSLLGRIHNDEMQLSEAGIMIDNYINQIVNRFPNTNIVNYVIMPNHIHIILENIGEHYMPEIIRWFKSITTVEYIKGVKNNGWVRFDKNFWQRNYYDHIIRTQKSFDYIMDYIDNNVLNWANDQFYYPENQSM